MASISKEFDAYWSERYENNDSPWDIGYPSPALINYCGHLPRNTRILIPGCGSAYEAEWLAAEGFTDICVLDISKSLVEKLQQKFAGINAIKLIHADFFAHAGAYDLLLEQTFFCALPPRMRRDYAIKVAELLVPHGKLAGVFFNKQFESGPPFGGSEAEYRTLFREHFNIEKMEPCYNSIAPRRDAELFVVLQKQ